MQEFEPLVRGCLRNDRKSQEKLYTQLYVPLYLLCRRFFKNEHEAIESVNDGMIKVFENIALFNPDKGKFFNWVYTIVRNTALDKFKGSAVSSMHVGLMPALEETVEADESFNPVAALEGKELYVLLDRLPPATRVVCNLFYIEGYPVKEIAERLEIGAGTVKWHLSESRKKLRSTIQREQLNK